MGKGSRFPLVCSLVNCLLPSNRSKNTKHLHNRPMLIVFNNLARKYLLGKGNQNTLKTTIINHRRKLPCEKYSMYLYSTLYSAVLLTALPDLYLNTINARAPVGANNSLILPSASLVGCYLSPIQRLTEALDGSTGPRLGILPRL